MNGGTIAAELFGGVGLFLLGTRLSAAGFGVAAGSVLRRRFASWTDNAPMAFLSGVALAGVVPGSGALPGSALGLARSGRLGTHRAARLVIGCGFGIAVAALLVIADRAGWFAQALGLAALGLGALFAELSPRRAAIGELAAGWGLVLLGVHLVGSGWAGVGEHGHLRAWLPVSLGVGMVGAVLALALRSPAVVGVLAVQAAANGAIDALLAAATIVGAAAVIPIGTFRAARNGNEQDLTVATLHGLHAALSVLLGIGLLLWSAGLPALAPAFSLAMFTLVVVGVPALVAWPFFGALEHFLLARFDSRARQGGSGATARFGAQTVPALAVERLALAVEDAAATTFELARKVLNGTGVSKFRRDELEQTVHGVEAEVVGFRHALESVRWPGASVARVLHAERAARGYRALCARLIALGGLEGKDPGGPLARPFLQARLGVLRFVEGGDEGRGTLDERRAAVESRLEELRIAMLYAFAADALGVAEFDECSRRLEDLRGLTRLAADTQDARSRLVLHDAELFETWEHVEAEPELEEDAEAIELEEAPSLVGVARTRNGTG